MSPFCVVIYVRFTLLKWSSFLAHPVVQVTQILSGWVETPFQKQVYVDVVYLEIEFCSLIINDMHCLTLLGGLAVFWFYATLIIFVDNNNNNKYCSLI